MLSGLASQLTHEYRDFTQVLCIRQRHLLDNAKEYFLVSSVSPFHKVPEPWLDVANPLVWQTEIIIVFQVRQRE